MTRVEYTDQQEASVLERSGAHDISSAISATRRCQRALTVLDPRDDAEAAGAGAGQDWYDTPRAQESTLPAERSAARATVVGQHVQAEEGMRVVMRPEYMSRGAGTIRKVNTKRGYVAVAWDSGRVDPVVFVGGRPAGAAPQTHPQTHPQTPATNAGGCAGANATLPFHLELVRDPCDGVFPPRGVAGKGVAGGTLGAAARTPSGAGGARGASPSWEGVAGKGVAGGALGVAAVASRLHRDVISPAKDRDVNTVARVLMQSVIGNEKE